MTIRRRPEDFVVTEVLAWSLDSPASPPPKSGFAIYRLTKRSMTTPEAASHLGKLLGAPRAAVDYAGLKDKHALTHQHISVRVGRAWTPRPRVEASGWHATLEGYSPEAINAGAITGNQFQIVVRDLSRQAAEEMSRRASLLEREGAVVVFNYFGDQRFGSARHGQGFVATRLIKGDFEGALKLAIATPARKDSGKSRTFSRLAANGWGQWGRLAEQLPRCPERRAIECLARGGSFQDAFTTLPYFLQSMYVEAYQSHLWNATARTLARTVDPEPIVADDDFGDLVFPRASTLADPWMSLEVPVLTPGVRLEEPWAAAASQALAAESLTQRDLRIPRLRRPYFGNAQRALVARASGFAISAPEQDELSRPGRVRVSVGFTLPRGAYATVVLRALGQ